MRRICHHFQRAGRPLPFSLPFEEQVEYSCRKSISHEYASKALASRGILVNCLQPRRCIPLCGTVLHVLSNVHKPSKVHRRTVLWVCSPFTTISDVAVFVITGMMLTDILVNEITNIYNGNFTFPLSISRPPKKGRLTHRLISVIDLRENLEK